METTAFRILATIAGAVGTFVLYGVGLDFLQKHLGYEALHFHGYQLILLIIVPVSICIAWSIIPNIFRRFDKWSLVSGISAYIASQVIVFYGAIMVSCGTFGDCF